MTNINGDNSNNLHPLMAMLEKEFGHCAIRLDWVSKHRPLEVCVSTVLLADNWSPVERPLNKWCLSKAWSYGTKEAKLDDRGSSRVSEATLAFCVTIGCLILWNRTFSFSCQLVWSWKTHWPDVWEKRDDPKLVLKCRVLKFVWA